ncbi:hypothetical protein ACFQ2C_17830 [Sphingobacterium daejeonense]|uniref:Uncharacterized protein n=1 Tax=Sphingobacterium daejeonense TaxID=371142 RepID=A0ABW3RS32_9SPHI
MPSELADKLHEEIEKGRKEWGEISIEMKITSNTNAVGVAYLLTPEGCNYYSDKIVSRAKALE